MKDEAVECACCSVPHLSATPPGYSVAALPCQTRNKATSDCGSRNNSLQNVFLLANESRLI